MNRTPSESRLIPTALMTVAALMLFGSLGAMSGCKSNDSDIPLTEADAARMTAENMERKQRMLEQGQEMVQDGEAEKARGQALVDQGNTVKGQPMVASGEAKIAQGNAVIDRANEMEVEVEPIDVNVGDN